MCVIDVVWLVALCCGIVLVSNLMSNQQAIILGEHCHMAARMRTSRPYVHTRTHMDAYRHDWVRMNADLMYMCLGTTRLYPNMSLRFVCLLMMTICGAL